MRTKDDSTRKLFRCHWGKMFDHEQDSEDIMNFEINDEDMENDALIYNKPISTTEVHEALRKMKNGKAFDLDELPREFLRQKKRLRDDCKNASPGFQQNHADWRIPDGSQNRS